MPTEIIVVGWTSGENADHRRDHASSDAESVNSLIDGSNIFRMDDRITMKLRELPEGLNDLFVAKFALIKLIGEISYSSSYSWFLLSIGNVIPTPASKQLP